MTAFILGARRTPIGRFQGALSKKTAPQLGAHAIEAALNDAQVTPDSVDEVYMGNVVSAGLKQAPARQAMRDAQIPDSTPSTTINKVCGSGMKATMIAADQISLKRAHCVVAGGMESMTNMPYLMPRSGSDRRMGHKSVHDSMFLDGLEDAESGRTMGQFAQETADQFQLTRSEMDRFAIRSVEKARDAMDSGIFDHEIEQLEALSEDEQPRFSQIDRIPCMRPAFAIDGTITAANASSISDGASCLVVGSESFANSNCKPPIVRIVDHVSIALDPHKFVVAPIYAIQALLDKTGWDRDSVDLFEINEAFAAVTMITIRELNLDPNKVNVYGGACAQGHPLGSTGCRLIVTLAHALAAKKLRRGIASLCIGGGEGTAIALERV